METQEIRDKFSSALFMKVEVHNNEQYKKLLKMFLDMGCSWYSGDKWWGKMGEYNRYVYVVNEGISIGADDKIFNAYPSPQKIYEEVEELYRELTMENTNIELRIAIPRNNQEDIIKELEL